MKDSRITLVVGLLVTFLIIPSSLFAITTQTFTNTSTGRDGTIQSFSVPADGPVWITTIGAQGGTGSRDGTGGWGALISTEMVLADGDQLDILVGQKGNTDGNTEGPSGGGASVVTFASPSTESDIIAIAGGGGGYGVGTSTNAQDTAHANTKTWGKDGFGANASSDGGTGGDGGGSTGNRAGAGGGYFTDGGDGSSSGSGGRARLNGGQGGDGGSYPDGGFGSGGATDNSTGFGAGAGGGGYSGGGGGYSDGDSAEAAGGGGGSYIGGDTIIAASPVRKDHGEVKIHYRQPGVTITEPTSNSTKDAGTVNVRWDYDTPFDGLNESRVYLDGNQVCQVSGETFNATSSGRDGSIQNWTVPEDGVYRITTMGAAGATGSRYGVGGKGALMSGEFKLQSGDALDILVGQKGSIAGNDDGPSGGGGTFVTYDSASSISDALIVAGGGGGYAVGTTRNEQSRAHAHTKPWGKDGFGADSSGPGGADGNGGEGATNGSGGGGFVTNGTGDGPGEAYLNGGSGGLDTTEGGFGGGGAGGSSGSWGAGGGGGGFSGGGGGYSDSTDTEGAGGGGGSFNVGQNQENKPAFNHGDGQVIIEYVGCQLDNVSSGSHTVEVQIDDKHGNTESDQVDFSVDPKQPDVSVTDPADTYFATGDVTVKSDITTFPPDGIAETRLKLNGTIEHQVSGSFFENTDFGPFGKIQSWSPPQDGYFDIRALGASGGDNSQNRPGYGAEMKGEFQFGGSESLQVLVGQKGYEHRDDDGDAGGGGSFLVDSSDNPLLVAGGGAGGYDNTNPPDDLGDGYYSGSETDEGGVTDVSYSCGGGSFSNDGADEVGCEGGSGFLNGGFGGTDSEPAGQDALNNGFGHGGFGGGGAVSDFNGGGGGGGYEGGDVDYGAAAQLTGGGSFIDGSASLISSTDGANTGPGSVSIAFSGYDFTGLADGEYTARVEVDDKLGNTSFDTKYFVVDTQTPAVAVTDPADGEEVVQESDGSGTYTVKWDATDAGPSGYDSFTLEYRPDTPADWSTIEADLAGDSRSVVWSPPKHYTNSARIRIQTADKAGNTNSDSTGTFKLHTKLYTEIDTPVASTKWRGGVADTIFWSAPATGISNYEDFVLEFAPEGNDFTQITTVDGSKRKYSWTKPEVNTDSAQVRINSQGASGGAFMDTSPKFVIDSEAPSVSWQDPQDGDWFKGTKTLKAEAIDDRLTADTVHFWQASVGDTKIGTAHDSNNDDVFETDWNTDNVADTHHDLVAVGVDTVGNTETATVTIGVDHTSPESATIQNPSGGQTVSNFVDYEATASDTLSPIDKIEFDVDGGLEGTDNDTPFSIEWNTNNYSNGDHNLQVTAFDRAGNSVQSSQITVTVDNANFISSVDLPNAGDLIRGDTRLYTQWTMQNDNLPDTINNGGQLATIYFEENFSSPPVVIAQVQDADNRTTNAQVQNITTDGADIYICQMDGGSSTCPGYYDPPFEVSYVAFEPGKNPLSGSLDYGVENCSGGGSWCNPSYSFSQTPAILTTIQTDNEPDQHKPTMARNVGTSGADIRFCLYQGSGCESTTYNEDVGWLAISTGSFGSDAGEAGIYTGDLSDAQWQTVSFNNTYSDPIAFVTSNTYNGGQVPKVGEVRYLTSDTMQLRICEHDNSTSCDSHTDENAAYAVFERSDIDAESGIEAKKFESCSVRYTDGSGIETLVASVDCYDEVAATKVPEDNTENAEVEIEADDGSGEVDQRRSGDFTVDSEQPQDFSNLSPENNGCVADPNNATLKWEKNSDAASGSGIDHYQVWVDRPSDFVTYWPLEEEDQRNVIGGPSFSGEFQKKATLPDWGDGPRSSHNDNALQFDGRPEHVVTEWELEGLNDGGAVSMWVYYTDVSITQRSGVHSSGGSGRFYLGSNGGSQEAIFGYGDNYFINGALSNYTWHHLAVTYDGSTMRGYLDGTQVNSQSANFSTDTDTNVMLGVRAGWWGNWFTNNSRIGEVQIYRDHLTSSEVQRIANKQLPARTDPSTNSYDLWSLTDGDTYSWEIVASDQVGLLRGSSRWTFTVDTSNPEQSEIVDPNDGGYIGGNVELRAHAKDSPCGMGHVEFYGHYHGDASPKKLGEDRSDSPFRLFWDASSEPEGKWDLYVDAYDKSGVNKTMSDSITVTMDNTDPEITVTDPSPGEDVEGGQNYTIQWNAPDAGGSGYDSFDLSYREDPLDPWETIDTGVAGSNRDYTWSVPETWADSAAVRVTARDNAGNTASDTSGQFQIFVELFVDLLRPDGGEYWIGGDTETIEWEAPARDFSGIESYDSFELEERKNSGSAWSTITTISDTTQTEHVWDPLPIYNSGEVQVRLTANGTSGGSYADTSGQFWIDSTPPTASWVEPDTGDYVDGDVRLEADATDTHSNIEVVRFWHGDVGDTLIDTVGGTTPFVTAWNSDRAPDGWHTLTVQAKDRSGNTDTDVISVNNAFDAPVVTITNPAEGDAFDDGSVTWSAEVDWGSSNESDVRFYINDELTYEETSASGTTFDTTWETANYTEGSYELKVEAENDKELVGDTAINVFIIRSDPRVKVRQPEEGTTVSGDTDLLVDAASIGGIDYVEFYMIDSDGNWTTVDTVEGEADDEWHEIRFEVMDWDSTSLPDGSTDFRAVAHDFAGNTAYDEHTFDLANSGGASLSTGGTLSHTAQCPGGDPPGGDCTLEFEQEDYSGIKDPATITVQDTEADNKDSVEVDLTSEQDNDGITITLPQVNSAKDTTFRDDVYFTEGESGKDEIAVDPTSDSTDVTATYDGPSTIQASVSWRPDSSVNTLENVRTWPNPYDPTSGQSLVFQNLPADQDMEIQIRTVNGDRVRTLKVGDGIQYHPRGNFAKWDGRNYSGSLVASNMYLYVIDSSEGTAKGMITLVKKTSLHADWLDLMIKEVLGFPYWLEGTREAAVIHLAWRGPP